MMMIGYVPRLMRVWPAEPSPEGLLATPPATSPAFGFKANDREIWFVVAAFFGLISRFRSGSITGALNPIDRPRVCVLITAVENQARARGKRRGHVESFFRESRAHPFDVHYRGRAGSNFTAVTLS